MGTFIAHYTRAPSVTSSRLRDIGVPYINSRSGHLPQLSLKETNHHVTEANVETYGDNKYTKREARLIGSNVPPRIEVAESEEPFFDPRTFSWARAPDNENGNISNYIKSSIMSDSISTNSFEPKKIPQSLSPHSPTSKAPFTSPDISYETDPADFAQALSDLQALRRMSIDVASTSDPDLPPLYRSIRVPSIAPTGDDNDDDPSRLFWVPARVHPELAPTEFKSFLENKYEQIKQHAGDPTSTSLEVFQRSGSSNDSLRRKKSLLSRQLNHSSSSSSSDTLSRAESKGSISQLGTISVDLKELDTLVRNRSEAMRKLTLETNFNQTGLEDTSGLEDIPILPQPPGIGLRRSTRTTYRRGSFRREDRANFSKRVGSPRKGETSDTSSPIEEKNSTSPSDQTVTENFSHPIRGARRLQNSSSATNNANPSTRINGDETSDREESQSVGTKINTLPNLSSDFKVPRRSNTSIQDIRPGPPQRSKTTPLDRSSVPQIIETPPLPEPQLGQSTVRQLNIFPGRPSSQAQQLVQKSLVATELNPHQSKNNSIPSPQTSQSDVIPQQNLIGSPTISPSLVGVNSRTDGLTFIPTLDVKKTDKRSKKEKDDSDSHILRKTTWNWFKGGDDKDKKEKKKDDEREGKKSKKVSMEKTYDNARLDVLQSTLDNGATNGRESLVIDRDSLESRSHDEKKKESRKFSTEKKEKDSIFSSIFGGGKKKSDRDGSTKKGSSLRALSPDPFRFLKPDVDYNWTRFSILEERAIYRMAHIKLANPHRALYSQVLLSNFMYSYLAKVQQMHPQLQIPQSAQQKKQELERRQKEQEQQAMQQLQEIDQYRYDYHEGITKYAEGDQQPDYNSDRVNYVDDSQIYDYDHQQDSNSVYAQKSNRPQSRASQNTGGNGYENELQYGRMVNEYYQVTDQQISRNEDEMW
ncbi:putative telomere silencing protein [Erysiphe neolycopersici]|uniref:Putative telomere silencing protein n=1 Tax=Erysiphe neolycopersici TaxID=212602 RepID=A0A420HV07_9PEZI|nr:putative telomere silencing protein [Erysiphe neolycopersici]